MKIEITSLVIHSTDQPADGSVPGNADISSMTNTRRSQRIVRVKCGDCRFFSRDGKCDWYEKEGKNTHPFAHAPFWVWSDYHNDTELVRATTESTCVTFERKRNETKTPGN
jgi:hypothetical protein